ncbi:MAG: hypothetical protein HYY93_09525 [Planctomycetes bacterium]|nr:hypothetical protein [Planctomycetota bacterium]
MQPAQKPTRGSVLIVSLGTLAVLAVFAFVFVGVAKSERSISSNYVDMVRARMLAVSGMEAAVAHLRRCAGVRSWDGLTDEWAFGMYDPMNAGTFEPLSLKLEQSRAPSFCLRVGGPLTLPIQVNVDGAQRGCSGILPGTYELNGDTYAVKVIDASSKINLNGRQPNMAQMLVNLGTAMQMAGAPYNPIGAIANANAIIAFRNGLPGGQILMMEQFRQFVKETNIPPKPATVTEEDHFNLLASCLTVYGWVDLSVIKPKAQIAPTYNNWLPCPQSMDFSYNGGGVLNGQYMVVDPPPISISEAYTIATHIDDYRKRRVLGSGGNQAPVPFTNWQQFNAYINGDGNEDGLVDPAPPANLQTAHPAVGLPASAFSPAQYAPYHRGIIQAMANPNSDLEKFNPTRAMTRSAIVGANVTAGVDKSDLTYYTTEFCFQSSGYFEIESLGRVTGGGGQLRAAHKVRSVVKTFDQVRLTTQREFLTNKSGTGSGQGFQRTVSYPENVRNRTPAPSENASNPAMGSILDGQISLKDRLDTANAVWNAPLDDKVQGSDNYTRPNPYFAVPNPSVQRAYRCLQGITLFNPSGTAPAGTMHLSGGDVDRCSDLYADGLFVGTSRNRMPSWSYSPTGPYTIPNQAPPPGNMHPANGKIGFWVKPVANTGGKLSAVVSILLLGKDKGQYSGSFFPADIYGVFMTKDWINGGHCSKVSGGVILPNAHYRNDLTYPFGSNDYFVLTQPAPWNNYPFSFSDWHYVEFTWTNYYNPWKVYIDGVQRASAPGWIINSPGYVYLNTTNIIDDMQIAQVFLPAYWGSVWKWMTEGTFDNLMTYGTNSPSTSPFRYDPTMGGSYYEGSIPWPAGVPASVRVLNITWTQHQPKFRSTDGSPIAPSARPWIQLKAIVNGNPYDLSTRGDGLLGGPGGTPVGGTALVTINTPVSTASPITYKAEFYDNGVTPSSVAPYLDDVTLTYTSGVKYLYYVDGD